MTARCSLCAHEIPERSETCPYCHGVVEGQRLPVALVLLLGAVLAGFAIYLPQACPALGQFQFELAFKRFNASRQVRCVSGHGEDQSRCVAMAKWPQCFGLCAPCDACSRCELTSLAPSQRPGVVLTSIRVGLCSGRLSAGVRARNARRDL
jgi:hypothetical protein